MRGAERPGSGAPHVLSRSPGQFAASAEFTSRLATYPREPRSTPSTAAMAAQDLAHKARALARRDR
jgi:hypothetical protein